MWWELRRLLSTPHAFCPKVVGPTAGDRGLELGRNLGLSENRLPRNQHQTGGHREPMWRLVCNLEVIAGGYNVMLMVRGPGPVRMWIGEGSGEAIWWSDIGMWGINRLDYVSYPYQCPLILHVPHDK